jgi:enoyl-CoA hydratase
MQRGIALVRMSKPPVNAIDMELAAGLGGALNGLASEEGVRAVVLAGLEGCFSAGLDLKALPHLNAAEQKELLLTFGRMILDLYRFPRPVIAAVDGHAIAGGLILVIACDYRIGGDGDYQLGLTEVRVGVPFPIAPLRLVQAELGPDVARRLVLTSRTAGPREALEWGALDELRPPGEVEARALEIAEELAALPSISYTRTKHLLREETIGQMEDAVDRQLDPALSGWLTPESASAAARVLGQD